VPFATPDKTPPLTMPIGRDRLLTAIVLADLTGIAITKNGASHTQTR
jgi:hypothetical protein